MNINYKRLRLNRTNHKVRTSNAMQVDYLEFTIRFMQPKLNCRVAIYNYITVYSKRKLDNCATML